MDFRPPLSGGYRYAQPSAIHIAALSRASHGLTTSPLRGTPLSGGIVTSTLGYSYRCAFSCFARADHLPALTSLESLRSLMPLVTLQPYNGW